MITPRLSESEVALHKEYLNGVGRPWIDLIDFALPEDLLRRLTATFFSAVPVYLSEAQSTMIKLERATAVWTQYEFALAEYEDREHGRRRQCDAWSRVAQAVQSHLDQTAHCARVQLESLVKRFAKRLMGLEEVSIDPQGRLFTGGLSPALVLPKPGCLVSP
jgi:hypothetical protein